jgi:hypothetical protein
MSQRDTRAVKTEMDRRKERRARSASVEQFAKNLHNPTHQEFLDDGRLLVSEHTAGRVMEISEGGDFVNSEPFAKGLEGPASIVPLDNGRILVSEPWAGRVTEITGGGDFSEADPFLEFDGKPYSLSEKDGRVYLSISRNGTSADIITFDYDGGNQRTVAREFPIEPRTPGLTPMLPDGDWQANWEDYAVAGCGDSWVSGGESGVYVTVSPTGHIIDIENAEGETFMELLEAGYDVASGLGSMGGIKYSAADDLLYGSLPEEGGVFAVDPTEPENHQFTNNLVDGLIQPSCLRLGDDGAMYVCGRGEGVIWRITDY